jgi:nitroreductase
VDSDAVAVETDTADVAQTEGAEWNPVERVILERRSVRKYKDKQVPENLVRRILEAGRFAPSAGNSQPWKFIVIRDQALIDRMERDMHWFCKILAVLIDWRESPLGRRIPWLLSQVFIRFKPNDFHPMSHTAIIGIGRGLFTAFHGAPTLIFILKDKRGASRPEVDVGCCGQNMVLAAHSLGLGTCWVGFVDTLNYLGPLWKRRLGVEWPYTFCEAIALGYPVGHPDGMIPRETQEIDWYEDGVKRTVY